MILKLNVLGLDIWRLSLDIEQSEIVAPPAKPVSIVDRGVKAMSSLWVRKMMAG